MVTTDKNADSDVTKELARITAEGTDAKGFASVVRGLAASAKTAGTLAVASGRWFVDTAIDLAGQLPVRDADALAKEFPGRTA